MVERHRPSDSLAVHWSIGRNSGPPLALDDHRFSATALGPHRSGNHYPKPHSQSRLSLTAAWPIPARSAKARRAREHRRWSSRTFHPFRIPKVKIEVIDVSHLPTPIHVGRSSLLLPFPPLRSPDRGFLLGDADQHYAIFSFPSGGFPVRVRQLFFIFPS